MMTMFPLSSRVSLKMACARPMSTRTNLNFREIPHAHGFSDHLHMAILNKFGRVVDIVFPSAWMTIQVGGRFWHSFPRHAFWLTGNYEFQYANINAIRSWYIDAENRLKSRDGTVIKALKHEGACGTTMRIADFIHA